MAEEKTSNVVVNVMEAIPVRLNLLHLQVMDIESGGHRECWCVVYETTVQGKDIQVPVRTFLGMADTAQSAMEVAASRSLGLL